MSANNSKWAVLKFAAIVCLVCSLVVSLSAVSLRSFQERNKLNEKRFNILVAAGLAKSSSHLTSEEIDKLFNQVLPVVVNLKTGELVKDINANTYDMYTAANNPAISHKLTNDPANIQRIANDASAYLVLDNNKIESVVLPIQGYGLWSTMYGFTAIHLTNPITISGLTFYRQAETPGLGAEITNPTWQKKWIGVLPYDAAGHVDIKVTKSANSSDKHEVDSISGATLTSRGVQNMMNFWLGNQGFKLFIQHLQDGTITVANIKAG